MSSPPVPSPWQLMEPWRRAVLVAAVVVVALSYVCRTALPSTDMASRMVVVVVGLASLLVWSRRPRPDFGEGGPPDETDETET